LAPFIGPPGRKKLKNQSIFGQSQNRYVIISSFGLLYTSYKEYSLRQRIWIKGGAIENMLGTQQELHGNKKINVPTLPQKETNLGALGACCIISLATKANLAKIAHNNTKRI
jgi:hypothetical protein